MIEKMIEQINNNSETQIEKFKKEYKKNNIIWPMISSLFHNGITVSCRLLKNTIPDVNKTMLYNLHTAYPMITVDKKTFEIVEKWIFDEEKKSRKKEDKIKAMQVLVNPQLTKQKSEAELQNISNTLKTEEEVDEFYKINLDILKK
jgi:hypothetical protein